VLGNGGLKGFAHSGVLRAIEDDGIGPIVVAGFSIGLPIAAAYAGGMSTGEMAERAGARRNKNLFRISRIGIVTILARHRSRAAARA
jgi:NTE family protein